MASYRTPNSDRIYDIREGFWGYERDWGEVVEQDPIAALIFIYQYLQGSRTAPLELSQVDLDYIKGTLGMKSDLELREAATMAMEAQRIRGLLRINVSDYGRWSIDGYDDILHQFALEVAERGLSERGPAMVLPEVRAVIDAKREWMRLKKRMDEARKHDDTTIQYRIALTVTRAKNRLQESVESARAATTRAAPIGTDHQVRGDYYSILRIAEKVSNTDSFWAAEETSRWAVYRFADIAEGSADHRLFEGLTSQEAVALSEQIYNAAQDMFEDWEKERLAQLFEDWAVYGRKVR